MALSGGNSDDRTLKMKNTVSLLASTVTGKVSCPVVAASLHLYLDQLLLNSNLDKDQLLSRDSPGLQHPSDWDC